VARLPPSFVAVAAGPAGNTSWWRFERGNDDDDVLAVKSVASGIGGLGRPLGGRILSRWAPSVCRRSLLRVGR
jgi:hypothetical protein